MSVQSGPPPSRDRAGSQPSRASQRDDVGPPVGAGDGEDDSPGDGKGTGFLAVLQSVAAAGIGVQSSKNRERDFKHGKPVHFIVGGLLGTALFLLAVYLFVRVLLATA